MTTRNIRGAPAAMLTLSLLAMLLVPAGRAFGGTPEAPLGDGQTDEGWKKVLAYARCAFHVFRAVTPADWTVATLDCGRLLLEESALPGGGRP